LQINETLTNVDEYKFYVKYQFKLNKLNEKNVCSYM